MLGAEKPTLRVARFDETAGNERHCTRLPEDDRRVGRTSARAASGGRRRPWPALRRGIDDGSEDFVGVAILVQDPVEGL
jgi:hypothetical protein